MILRTISCDVPGCTSHGVETVPDSGWAGWGQMKGVQVGRDNSLREPNICPDHLRAIMVKLFGEETI